ncbi:hypothetical protein [Limimaricola pyoseonensis]|uniref:hypothetical protein n=1 Tax=Limimaricola pyoseonensis TaxID=521013 RepID=UPI000B7EB0BC|nr:hypothetical protein [Limimaricola pyoseonensis]
MDETAARGALLAEVKRGEGRRSTLLVLDAVPIHSLWIARHLHLLLELDLTVVIPTTIRAIFAARQDCRKGREVLAFLDRHTPPLVIRPCGPRELLDGLRHEMSDASTGSVFGLVGSSAVWPEGGAAQNMHLVDVRDLAAVAEHVGLLENMLEIAHAIELPGEVVAWR